jgi:hypothetical protein
MIEFTTKYNYKPVEGVTMSDELITEQTGYRETSEIVESMILAGQRLAAYRHDELDNYDEDYDDQFPIEIYDKDIVDARDEIVSRIRFIDEQKKREKIEEKTDIKTKDITKEDEKKE